MNQLELQESLQRFYTRFSERTLEGLLQPKLVNNPALREEVMRQYLLYDQEALKIVTGPYTELNLLDMIVYIKLNTLVIRDYWIPRRWKKSGIKILKSFRDSEKDIDEIAGKILRPEQMNLINQAVVAWRRENPHQFRVEKVRLDNFSKYAGYMNQKDSGGFSLSQIFIDTKGAVKAVDQMVLVSNRAIFLMQYLPSLMRLQTRVGIAEISDDMGYNLQRFDRTLNEISQISPTLTQAALLARDSNQMLLNFRKAFPHKNDAVITANLKRLQTIVDESHDIVNQMNANKVKELLLYAGLVFVIAGSIIAAVFWLGYYLVINRPARAHP